MRKKGRVIRYFKKKNLNKRIHNLRFPIIKQVQCKTIFMELDSVIPKNETDLDSIFKIISSKEFNEPIYYPVVTSENIEYVKAQFETDDVQFGDTVEHWDLGGWESLAGRAGIALMRNGEEIKSILTRMS